jgi:hypothetical protein
MRALIIGLLSFFIMTSTWADTIEPLLNKVTLQLSAEQWVTSKTALVAVSINAAVSDQGLEKIHSQVLDKLTKLSNQGEWHVISYDRSQDKSGLESVQIMAQARLAETALAGLRAKAKSISKPGETYSVSNIQFTPSDNEIRDANNFLRENIYEQAKAEIANLNKQYPEQKYYLHDINFISDLAPLPMAQTMAYTKVAGNGPANAALVVGDKMRVVATVILAANPEQSLLRH